MRIIAMPDFNRLTALLLKDSLVIQLMPYELTEGGKAMRLLPARGGVPIDSECVDERTLPVLELEKAGIDWDRNAENLARDVSEFLAQHSFVVWPTFNLPKFAAIAPLMAQAIEMQAIVVGFDRRFADSRPTEREIKNRLLAPLQGMQIGFWIRTTNTIPGLNLSRPVNGSILAIPHFIYPNWGMGKAKTPAEIAFQSAVMVVQARRLLRDWEKAYRAYLDPKTRRWYQRFWNWSPGWKRHLASVGEFYEERVADFRTKEAAALQAQ